jgi:hypothetical protein
MLIATAHHLAAVNPRRFEEVFTANAFEGRKGRRFQKQKAGLRQAKEVPGGYAEMNLSSDAIVREIVDLLRFCDLDPTSASYECRVAE